MSERATTISRRVRGAWVAAGVLAAGSAAWAQPKASAMPDEAWSALLVDRGAAWREHEPTRRLIERAIAGGMFADTKSAWTELAGSMGLDDRAAFDALLGERAMLVLGLPQDKDTSAWGVVSCVTPENATALERGLDAAPRGFDQGRAVMLVERGNYRLGRLDRRDGLEEVEGWHRMLLTPAGEGEGGVGGGAWIARTIGVAEGLPRSTGEVTWFQRTDGAGSYLVASVAREERGWRAKVRGTPGVLGLTQAGCERLAKMGPGDGLGVGVGAGVLFEMSGCLPTQATDLVEPSKELTDELRLLLAAARVGAPSPKWSGERVVVRVERTRGEGAGEDASGWTVVVACEVKDRRAASEWFDALIAGVLEIAGRVQGTGVQAAADLRRDVKLAGNEPGAMRLVVLGGAGKPAEKTPGKPKEKDVRPEHGTLAWTTVGADAGLAEGGWWVMRYSLGPGTADARASAEESLRAVGSEIAAARWGSRVVTLRARPAELWKAAGLAGLEPGVLATALAGGMAGEMGLMPMFLAEVESVEMVVRATAEGLAGEASVRLTEPKPARASEPK